MEYRTKGVCGRLLTSFFDMKIQLKSYLGLLCHTIYKSQVKYFIFVDIDTKDKEVLRAVIQEVARAGLSFWILETKKGYHVISPNMLDILEWHRLKTSISKFLENYYVFYVIRWITKPGDRYIGYWSEWLSGEPIISKSMIRLMKKRFKTCRDIYYFRSDVKRVDSTLNFNRYEHHEII